MYDVWSRSLTSDVMEYEDAVEIYNTVASRYNEIVSLYDTCDCREAEGVYHDIERLPLYDPETEPTHSVDAFGTNWTPDLLNKCICLHYDHSNREREGVGIIQVIAGLCKKLEDLSLKQHGPLNEYYPNGYVQLYTEAQLDPETGDPYDEKNGLGIDARDNVCADLDNLDPGEGNTLDSSTFLESKVYPIITTVDPEKADSCLSNALSTFNTVAALPKKCSVRSRSYSVGIYLSYEHRMQRTSKAALDAKLHEIYSKIIGCLTTDYTNWYNDETYGDVLGGTGTWDLYPALHSIEQKYTSDTDQEYLHIGTWDHNQSYSYPSGVYYCKPYCQYFIEHDSSGNEYCTSASIAGIAFSVVKLTNPYLVPMHLSGLVFNRAAGTMTLADCTGIEHEHIIPLTDHIYPRDYNSYFGHLTAVRHSTFSATIPACGDYMLLPSALSANSSTPVSYVEDFPTHVWEDHSGYTPVHVIYDGTSYPCLGQATNEYHGKTFSYAQYLSPPPPSSNS